MKKIIVLSLVVISIIGVKVLNNKDNENEINKKALISQNIQNEIIKEQIVLADKFITELKTNLSINVLEEVGYVSLNHDKTPENNWWSEWLYNSELTINTDYKVTITLNINDISLSNINGIVYANIHSKDFNINSIELFNTSSIESKKLLGDSYNSKEVIAIENQIKDEIKSDILTDSLIEMASKNIYTYLTDLTDVFNVPIVINID